MQDILFSAVIDAITALKGASKGVPNAMLRDLNAVHPNITFADLPGDVQQAIAASVRSAFTRMLKEGYAVAPARDAPRSPPPRPPGAETRRPRGPAGIGKGPPPRRR